MEYTSSSSPVEAQQAANTPGLRLGTRVAVVAARSHSAGRRNTPVLGPAVVRSSPDWDR